MSTTVTLPANTTNGPLPKLCPACLDPLGQNADCPICQGHTAEQQRVQIQAARNRIRRVIGMLKPLSVHLRAYDSSDDWDRPNTADAAIDELTLVLEALAPAGTRWVCEVDPSLGPIYEEVQS